MAFPRNMEGIAVMKVIMYSKRLFCESTTQTGLKQGLSKPSVEEPSRISARFFSHCEKQKCSGVKRSRRPKLSPCITKNRGHHGTGKTYQTTLMPSSRRTFKKIKDAFLYFFTKGINYLEEQEHTGP
nr:uncharacterized protein LOC109026338 isoform X2 [Gorilla gorilla gorilla]